MSVKLLTEHHLEFLSIKEGCRGSSESTLVKMPHCWKSHVLAHILRAGIVPVSPGLYMGLSVCTSVIRSVFLIVIWKVSVNNVSPLMTIVASTKNLPSLAGTMKLSHILQSVMYTRLFVYRIICLCHLLVTQ